MKVYEVWSANPMLEARFGVMSYEIASSQEAAIVWCEFFPLGVVCVREVGSEVVHKFEVYEHQELRARPVKEES